jgi:hypothetical protein
MPDEPERGPKRPLPAEATEVPEVWVDWQLAPTSPSPEKPLVGT